MSLTKVLPAYDPQAIALALRILHDGGVIAFPTDTVYGVGAHALQPSAVERLYLVKERPRHMAIPLLLGQMGDLDMVAAQVPEVARLLIARFWPGGLTIVVPRSTLVPDIVTAGGNTVAVRLPDHPVPRALATGLGAPVCGTSANLSGSKSPVTAQDVLADLDGRIDLLLDGGPCPGGIESSIVDVTGPRPRLLREGAISRQALAEVLGEPLS